MDDLKWLAIILGLTLVGLIYVRLLGTSGEEHGS